MAGEANKLETGGQTMISDEDLTPELQRFAEEELGETDESRVDALARLNQLLDAFSDSNGNIN
ncbi:hypothetical protein IscW_ISCW014304 [Ixodes scapularis]|uniref:Uncharacterized protein n=1 Tax=Ixodes scapularis TaxID=6945 RepID=B7QLQ1_IXOSC|nr:hypothetical protein IscW_ISCW014304 [Ixodes scapularis]|eukprot:XP_002416106.1 hypothetical protein IscW_ISCW014304 [Ixodes scapularis]